MLNFETSLNPIVNIIQHAMALRLNKLFEKNPIYYGLDFDYFYISIKNLFALKKAIEQHRYEVYGYSGSSREILIIDEDETILKINYVNDIVINKEQCYKMSYNCITRHVIERDENKILSLIKKFTIEPPVNIKTYNFIMANGKLQKNENLLDIDPVINQYAYPYIPNINNFIKSYINSNESVLIVRGKAGTGKTTFLRKLVANDIDNIDIPVYYTCSSNVIQTDELFSTYLSSKSKYLLCEDMDLHLTAREDGNVDMYKLLSTSDGFLKDDNNPKKILLSSNINKKLTLDSALVRDGRCFDNIEFRELTYKESCDFMESISKSPDLLDKKINSYSLATLYKMANKNV